MASASNLDPPGAFSLGELPSVEFLFGKSPVMQAIRQKAERVAAVQVPILIQGASGTGKEVLAKYIHRQSRLATGPFVKVNCPAIPGTLLESELFGYEKGAFTGAYGSKPGRVEAAHQGTLFLDEIAEIDPALQAKLLQLLQDGQFCRIGGQEERHVETRVICATNRQLDREVEAGRFRQDLYYRINVVSILLPTLQERIEDVPDLANNFLEQHMRRHNRRVPPLSAQLMRSLQSHSWPGNIRELENLIERYAILGSEEAITNELAIWDAAPARKFDPDLPPDGPISLKKLTRQAVQDLERKVIVNVLKANHWNRKKTAQDLKISYRALLLKIRQAGLPPKRSVSHLPVEDKSSALSD
jgi:two-component system response regulator AtoC